MHVSVRTGVLYASVGFSIYSFDLIKSSILGRIVSIESIAKFFLMSL